MRRVFLIKHSMLAIALIVASSRDASAEPGRCRAAILNATANHAQGTLQALRECEDKAATGLLPRKTNCAVHAVTHTRLSASALVLRTKIESACGGGNGACSVADTGPNADDLPGAVGFPPICPGLEGGACNNALADCNDLTQCLACITEEATAQAIALYYGQLVPTDGRTQRALNKCQRAIGKLAVKFATAQSKALGRCWSEVNRGDATPPCPVPGDGKALVAIRKAERAFAKGLCGACGGHDRQCDDAIAMPSGQVIHAGSAIAGSGGSDDLATSDIGFASTCNSVTVPGGAACGGPITTLAGLVQCVSCVTGFTVDCVERGAAQPFAAYPSECNSAARPAPTGTPTTTPTVTATPVVTPTVSASATPPADPCANVFCGPGSTCANGVCQCDGGTHDCGFQCMSLCSERPDYFLDRFESCFLTDPRGCDYCAGWMGCYGDLQTSQGLVNGGCSGGTCPAL